MKNYFLLTGLSLFVLWGCSGDAKVLEFKTNGDNALAAGNYDEAVAQYTDALDLNPESLALLNNRGVANQKRGRYDESYLDYTRALTLDPEYYDARYNRALLSLDFDQHFAALDDLDYLKNRYPDSSKVFFSMGVALSQARDFRQSVDAFSYALALDSGNAELFVNRATANYYRNEPVRALEDLSWALQLDPEEAEAHNTLAMVMSVLDKHDTALVHIDKAKSLDPENPHFLNNRGFVLLNLGRTEEARIEIEASLRIEPTNAWAVRNLALYHEQTGAYNEALRLLNRAKEMDDFVEDVYYHIGRVLIRLGKTEEACQSFTISSERKERKGAEALEEYCS